MLILTIIRFLRGWVKFSAYGAYPDVFLSFLFQNNIEIRDVYISDGMIYASIPARNYKELRKYAKKAGIRIKAAEKHGAPFVINRYHRRIGIAVGLALFAAILWVCSLYVWEIRIVGCEDMSPSTVLAAAQEIGITKGIMRKSIDERHCAEQLRYMLDDAAWVAVNIKNSVVQIEVTERTLPPDVSERHPCNVIAKCDGTIISSEVYSGRSLVLNGDGVTEGQLLISGVIEDQYGKTTFVNADGNITAKTEHNITVNIPYELTDTLPTGKNRHQYRLEFFWLNCTLGLSNYDKKPPYEMSDRSEDKKELILFGTVLPVSLTDVTYSELKQTTVTYDEQTAKQEAYKRLNSEEALRFGTADIQSREITETDIGDSFSVKAEYICYENIAIKQEFTIN